MLGEVALRVLKPKTEEDLRPQIGRDSDGDEDGKIHPVSSRRKNGPCNRLMSRNHSILTHEPRLATDEGRLCWRRCGVDSRNRWAVPLDSSLSFLPVLIIFGRSVDAHTLASQLGKAEDSENDKRLRKDEVDQKPSKQANQLYYAVAPCEAEAVIRRSFIRPYILPFGFVLRYPF